MKLSYPLFQLENNFKKKGLVFHNKDSLNFTSLIVKKGKKLIETSTCHCIKAESEAESWLSF